MDIRVRSYPSTILPLIVANIAYFYLDKGVKKIMPKSLDIILRPVICYLIIVLGIYFVVGPILYIIEQGLAEGAKYLEKIPFGIGTMLLSIF